MSGKGLHKENKHEKIKVIIIGSLNNHSHLGPRYKFNLKREVEVYNSTIEYIVDKHKINNDEIWYKHHPRLSYDSWIYKKNNMNCSIYDYHECILSEVELLNKQLKAVYSVGSTSLLYAKEIWGCMSTFTLSTLVVNPDKKINLFGELYNDGPYILTADNYQAVETLMTWCPNVTWID